MAVTDVTPRRIGPYEVHGLLGEGGIGQVYAAEDTLLGRQVAIKALRPEMSRDRNLIDRFYIEAKSLANLNHPHITTLYALQLEGQDAFMVMELVHGHTLNDLLAQVHRLSLRESLAVVAQAVAGLAYAHRRGVVHRDIKPSNLMVTDEGVLKIMDFGIARVRGSQQMTRTGDFQGTLAYASPEQIRGERVDERSDLYSLAIVLYKLLSGAGPFDGVGDYAMMTAHLQTPPPPLQDRVPGLDANTDAVLMRALAKRPEDRFASVAEFGQEIGAAALRNESVDILQQLFDRAFRGDAEATRVVPASLPPADADAPTQPTPRSAPQPMSQPGPQPALSDLLARSFAAPPISKSATRLPSPVAPPRRPLWPGFAVGGGVAAALALAGWFVLSPLIPERTGEASVAQEQPVMPSGEQREATQPDQVRPADEQRSPIADASVIVAVPDKTVPDQGAPTTIVTPEIQPSADKLAAATVAAPPGDKIAAPTAAPPGDKAALVSAVDERPPQPSLDAAASKTDDAKSERSSSGTQLATNDSQASAEKPAPMGPAVGSPTPQPEGKPDLEGRVTGLAWGEIEVNKQWLPLNGIVIDRRQRNDALKPYVESARYLVVCYRKPSDTYRCYADGQDIARLALRDRIARLAPNAPADYRSSLVQRR